MFKRNYLCLSITSRFIADIAVVSQNDSFRVSKECFHRGLCLYRKSLTFIKTYTYLPKGIGYYDICVNDINISAYLGSKVVHTIVDKE